MPLNERKIITTILNECNSIEARCDGYKDELIAVITEIISLERQHKVSPTNIQQKISDQCHAAGEFLTKQRGETYFSEERIDETNTR